VGVKKELLLLRNADAAHLLEPSISLGSHRYQPRAGKPADYVYVLPPQTLSFSPPSNPSRARRYRLKMWKKPIANFMGVMFTLHDSHLVDVHRADASIFEVSDASVSYALQANRAISGVSPVAWVDKHGKSVRCVPRRGYRL
jgi:hypothetical protein